MSRWAPLIFMLAWLGSVIGIFYGAAHEKPATLPTCTPSATGTQPLASPVRFIF